jgi:hypothetical protein
MFFLDNQLYMCYAIYMETTLKELNIELGHIITLAIFAFMAMC